MSKTGVLSDAALKHYGTKAQLLETISKKACQAAAFEANLYLKGLSGSGYISNRIKLPIRLTRSNKKELQTADLSYKEFAVSHSTF